MVSVATSMQERLTALKAGQRNKGNLLRTVDVLAVATPPIIIIIYFI